MRLLLLSNSTSPGRGYLDHAVPWLAEFLDDSGVDPESQEIRSALEVRFVTRTVLAEPVLRSLHLARPAWCRPSLYDRLGATDP